MSISSSLNAGVMGLSVNGTRLAAISDNIANAGTNGYKHDLLHHLRNHLHILMLERPGQHHYCL
jgi:flagellar basal body rod protein FlgG